MFSVDEIHSFQSPLFVSFTNLAKELWKQNSVSNVDEVKDSDDLQDTGWSMNLKTMVQT